MSVVKTLIRKATPSKLRYTQIGGKLGGLLTEIFIGKGWVKRSDKNGKGWYITERGRKILTEEGNNPV